MIDVSYTVHGADAVAAELARFRLDAIQSDIAAILDDMAGDAADYPPETGGTYVRTGDLGRGWTDGHNDFVQGGPTVLEAVRANSVSYSPFVQGAEDQAKVHQGRWKTTDALMADWEARVGARVEDAIEKVLPH